MSIDRDFDKLSCIEIGINLVVVESALPKIKEELADVIYGRLVADTVNVRHFLSNFREWQQYVSGGIDFPASGAMFDVASVVSETLDHEAFDPAVTEAALYYKTVSEAMDGVGSDRVRSSFVQGMLNVIIVCSRETLKFIRSSSSQIVDSTNHAIGKALGGLAAGWVVLNAHKLKEFADTHISLSWIKEVIAIVTRHLSGS